MPALVTATVLRWEVDGSGKSVHLKGSPTRITVVVGDATSSTDATPVIAEYILKAKSDETKVLLQAARAGLLQVTDMSRVPLTTPAPPPVQPDA